MNQNNLARKLRGLNSIQRDKFLRRVANKYENYFEALTKERDRVDDALIFLYRMSSKD